ncbi:hypothetical protein D3C72_1608280 [compost metagenome]
MVTPSSNCSSTAIDPLIHVSAATPTPTPTRLLTMAGVSSGQFTLGLARASVTAAFTSDSTLTTLATSDTDASWNTPDRPSSTRPNAKPVIVWA